MTFLASMSGSATALLLLQRPVGTDTVLARTASDTITSVAGSQTQPGKIGVTTQPSAGESKIAEAMFGVNNANIKRLKLDLIDRTGKAMGINQDDYASRDAFVDAMQAALGRLKIEGGDAAVHGLEMKLGLDKLGVSLQDVIDSARDPEANDKLTKALKRQAGIYGDNTDGNDVSPSLPGPDKDIGLYGPANS